MKYSAPLFMMLGTVCVIACPPTAHGQSKPPSLATEAQVWVDQLDDDDLFLRQKAFLELEALRDPASADTIRAHLTALDPNTRAFSARALAAVAGRSAVPVLLERWTKERHLYVRSSILIALEPFWEQEPAVVATVLKALRDRKRDIRMVAADIASHINRPEAREALQVRWKRERDRDVRLVLKRIMKDLDLLSQRRAS